MGEIHLCIVRARHYHHHKSIRQEVSKRFQLLKEVEISWNNNNYFNNFLRLYNKSKSIIYGKLSHCGTGPIKMFIFEDEVPIYEQRNTSSGISIVNKNVFDMKEGIRKALGGGHTVHGTNSTIEFNKDISLIAGEHGLHLIQQGKGYISEFPNNLGDPVGTNGWKSLKLFFDILRYHSEYVVLRNFKNLPQQATYGPHGDIDILVENQSNAVLLLNGRKVFDYPRRVHYTNKIGKGDVYFDIRSIGENYYDFKRSQDILKSKVLYNGIYIPAATIYFYSLLYHALIHKIILSDDYIRQLGVVAKKLSLSVNQNNILLFYRNILNTYMKKNGYTYVLPRDISVHYNQKIYRNYKPLSLFIFRYFSKVPIFGKYLLFVLGSIATISGENLNFKLKRIIVKARKYISK